MSSCYSLHSIYLKANGQLVCLCGAGESIVLGEIPIPVPSSFNFVHDILENERYRFIRESFKRGVDPFPICRWCAFRTPFEPYSNFLVTRTIDRFYVEGSFLCNLECLCCLTHKERIIQQPPPYHLAPDVLEHVLKDLYNSGINVLKVHFSGRGDSLMNPVFWDLVRTTNKFFSNAETTLVTNGNFIFSDSFIRPGVDRLIFSVDGFFDSNYSIYRRNGSILKACNLIEGVAKHMRKGQKIIYKYVLLEFNDSINEITAVQKYCDHVGVSELWFCITDSKYRSRRISPSTKDIASTLPIISSRASSLCREEFHEGDRTAANELVIMLNTIQNALDNGHHDKAIQMLNNYYSLRSMLPFVWFKGMAGDKIYRIGQEMEKVRNSLLGN